MRFKTLFMDADDTVFDFGAAQKAALFAAFKRMDEPLSEEEYALYDAINIKHWKMLERGETTKDRLVFARFEEFFGKTGKKCSVERTEELYQELLGEQAFWWEGAKEGMEQLSKRYDIFLVTNGHADTQYSRVKLSGLDGFVKDVFVSEAVGCPKPEKAYYDYCFRKSGADRKTTLCIGDSLTSDIKGGVNAGCKVMWCNFRNEPIPSDPPIDYVVRSWAEILDILL